MCHPMSSLDALADPEWIAKKIAFYARLEDEDRAGAALCASALTGPSAWWGTRLRQEKDHRTAGVVRELLVRFRDLVYRTPADALVLTAMASEIAALIGVNEYPFDYVVTLRGQALRDHAFILLLLGRFGEASAVAKRAEGLFRQAPVPHLELAKLDLVRSNIACSLGEHEEAIALARRAAKTFETFGDRTSRLKARDYEAAILFERRDYAGALAVWRSTETESHLLDRAQRASLLNNLGICLTETGEPVEAIRYLLRAGDHYAKLGLTAALAKTRHSLGVARLAAGQYKKAMALLRETWHELEALGMQSDAALSALRLCEALLVIGRVPEVAEICRTLIDRFTRLQMPQGTMIALAFLREALASGLATPAHARHVHDFLSLTQTETQARYVPLQ